MIKAGDIITTITESVFGLPIGTRFVALMDESHDIVAINNGNFPTQYFKEHYDTDKSPEPAESRLKDIE